MPRSSVILFLLILLALPALVLAQGGLVPCGQSFVTDPVTGQTIIDPTTGRASTTGEPCTLKHAIDLVISVINIAVQMSGVVAVLMIIWAGAKMVGAGIYANPDMYKDAKVRIWHAVFGLGIILAAYVIINSIVTLLFGSAVGGTSWFRPWR